MTLVEVSIAMVLTASMSAGLFLVGLKVQRFIDSSRLSSEARALAIERLEEMRALGVENLQLPLCSLINVDTNLSSRGHPIVRRPSLAWHGSSGAIVGVSSSMYVEATVEVAYFSFVAERNVTNQFTMLFR